MDFFQAQADAQRRTTIFIVLFAAAVLSIIAAIYVVAHATVNLGTSAPFQPKLFAVVAGGVLLLVGGGSAYLTLRLRRGGDAVAELLGGRRVSPQSTDPDERRLINLVEEMSIASGVPVPAIYLLEREQGINAFAAGHTIHDAAIGITRGALEHLSRDQLQGVIAHEFSHILNGDMRLNLRIMGILYGILLLTVVGRGLLRVGSSGSRHSRSKGGVVYIALVGAVLILVGYIGVFFGRLIQAAISRQREFLADAAAVQFTRNPAGIAGALKVIGAHAASSKIGNPHAEEAGHLLFASRARSSFGGLLATHPPLTERIRRIDPAFDGRFGQLPFRSPARSAALDKPGTTVAAQEDTAPTNALAPHHFLAAADTPTAEHLRHAGDLISALPEPLRQATRSPTDLPALLFALLYRPAGPGSERARAAIRGYGGEELLQRTESLAAELPATGQARFALLELALPTLRELPLEEIEALIETVDRLSGAAGRADPFGHALSQHLARKLDQRSKRPAHGTIHSLIPLRAPLEIVLSALAYAGADDEHAARDALAAAARALPKDFGDPTLRARERTSPAAVRQALDRLAAGAPGVRRRILTCAAHVVAADGTVRGEEAELIQAIAAALDCPVPPLVAASAATAPITAT